MTNQEIVEKVNSFLIDRLEMETELVKPGPTGAHRLCLFGGKPWVSSTKSMTGHENWMAGAGEAVYSILMMQHGFVAPNINLENVIDEARDLRIVRETIYTDIHTVLSNSSGMGGTNSAIVLRKV